MRNLIAFFISISLPFVSQAQVVSFDFEHYTSIPNGLGQWYQVPNVVNPSLNGQANPDYFHALGSASCDLPETPFAIVPAYSGQAMMGLAIASTKGNNTREYLSLQLPEPLLIGAKYKMSLPWTMGVTTPVSIAGLTVSDLGVLLTVDAPVQFGVAPIMSTPQFVFRQEFYSTNWKVATIEFVAQEASRYITIGLFGSDENKGINNRGTSNSSLSYYFFDEINLEKIADSVDYENPILFSGMVEAVDPVKADLIFVPNSFTPNGDGTNDSFLALDRDVEGWDLKIFNRWGQLVFESHSSMQGWEAKEIDKLVDRESFFWTLEFVSTTNEKVTQQGNVYLIR